MNATVTRSVTKSATTASTRKAGAKATAKPAVKTPLNKAALKSAAGKKPATTPAKRAASPVKTMPSARTAESKPTARKPATAGSVVQPRQKEMPAPSLRNSKGSIRPEDKMQQSAVSKASEVSTKTMKSNTAAAPTAPADGTLLTEEQILRMSDKDYMNEAQLAFFKARLQQLERDLLKNAGETTEHLRETVLVPDPADRATIEEEHALELRTRDRERKLLKKVQQSIASIDSGDYGWCEETGEPIGIPRLLARPTATLSLEAQQRRELKQKLYGD
jgi:DnaK suppressor protein